MLLVLAPLAGLASSYAMESLRVLVRIRPEEEDEKVACLRLCDGSDSGCKNTLQVHKTKENGLQDSHQFVFDKVFDPRCTQDEVFESVNGLIGDALKGFNVSIFAFGMTGSGKTHTISGSPDKPGIVPRTVRKVFSDLRESTAQSKDSVAMVFLTYIELYNNTLHDLLAFEPSSPQYMNSSTYDANTIKIHEHPTLGIQLSGSPSIRTPVSSAEEVLALIARGNKLRATASTNLNDRSSRSHTVISLEIMSKVFTDDDSSGSVLPTPKYCSGKINLIDLAGSENVKASGAEGQTLEEAKQINKALTVLGDVLNALSKHFIDHKGSSESVSKLPFIPYRNSKLTMLLKDSLGGNAKTVMIATARWSVDFYHQTLTALRYAARARHIRCNPTLNVGTEADSDSTGGGSITKALSEVTRLKQQLERRTQEFDKLCARMKQLERSKADSANSTATNGKESEELEAQYKKDIEKLKNENAVERRQLTAHLKSLIHNQEGKLMAREKEFVTLESQLERQLHSLQQAQMTNSELQKKYHENQSEIVRFETENIRLKHELSVALDIAAKAQMVAHDKEQFIDAVQKLTVSRAKHKKRADDAQVTIDKLDTAAKAREEKLTACASEIDFLKQTINEQSVLMAAAVEKFQSMESERTEMCIKCDSLLLQNRELTEMIGARATDTSSAEDFASSNKPAESNDDNTAQYNDAKDAEIARLAQLVEELQEMVGRKDEEPSVAANALHPAAAIVSTPSHTEVSSPNAGINADGETSPDKDALKAKLRRMVTHESEMMSSIESRLEGLAEAKHKLIKLVACTSSALSQSGLRDYSDLEQRLTCSETRVLQLEDELRVSRMRAAELQSRLEFKSQEVQAEKENAKNLLDQVDQARRGKSEGIKSTRLLVQRHVDNSESDRRVKSDLLAAAIGEPDMAPPV